MKGQGPGEGDRPEVPINVVLLGPPGAGKGTQAGWLARDYGLLKISTGDILREAVTQDSELGRLAGKTMESGRLVSDDVMIGIVRERLARPDTDRGVILDGFPRTVPQAVALDKLVQGRGSVAVLVVEVPLDVLVQRLRSRRICSQCGTNAEPGLPDDAVCARCGGTFVHRIDDEENVVEERLKIYQKGIEPLVHHYQGTPGFFRINGNQSPEAVKAQIRGAVEHSRAAVANKPMDVRP